MNITFAIRVEERNDVRALAKVRAELVHFGLRIDCDRPATAHRNGGLWQYEIPVIAHVETEAR